MTLTLKLIVFFSLLPFLEASRLKASIVKDVFCKDCEKLKSGMIQNFFVSDSGNVDLSMLTNINKKVDFGEEFFNYVSCYCNTTWLKSSITIDSTV